MGGEQEQLGQYVLLGKAGTNEWLPILLIYPELQDYSCRFNTLIFEKIFNDSNSAIFSERFFIIYSRNLTIVKNHRSF